MLKLPKITLTLGEKDVLALSFAGLTFVFIILGAASFISANSCARLARGEKATLVQIEDGTAFIASPKPPNFRSPKVVQNYVRNWVKHTFSLSGDLSVSGETVSDFGLTVEGKRIPTNIISGAYALPANKRKDFIEAYMKEGWIPEDYFSSERTIQEVELERLGEAQIIDEEKQIFSVNVVATISRYKSGKPTGEVDFYRRKIVVKSIPIPLQKPGTSASIYQQLSYFWRKDGLQISHTNPLSFDE